MPKTNKFDLDTASIRKLAKLLEETGLSEIEYAEGDRKIRCVGPRVGALQGFTPVVSTPALEVSEAKEPTGTPITSPMVGTVYMASSPDAAPFVKVGDKVKEGDTLLIIEAMKVMNPIKAPRAGTIGLILVEDAKPVEFGDTLIVLE
ncbi:MAG: biotin/lipoyl-containing protein [Bdellovibrionales bacterium]|jgi:acetyl-CoA carboxylase biotin carboxyl carrier protein